MDPPGPDKVAGCAQGVAWTVRAITGDKPANRVEGFIEAEGRDRGDTVRGVKRSGWGSIELSWVTWTATCVQFDWTFRARQGTTPPVLRNTRPEALDRLGSEERRTVYSMLGLRVDALPDKSLGVQAAFGEENLVCRHDRM